MQQAVGLLILDLLAVVCNTKLIMVLDKVLFLAHDTLTHDLVQPPLVEAAQQGDSVP